MNSKLFTKRYLTVYISRSTSKLQFDCACSLGKPYNLYFFIDLKNRLHVCLFVEACETYTNTLVSRYTFFLYLDFHNNDAFIKHPRLPNAQLFVIMKNLIFFICVVQCKKFQILSKQPANCTQT